MAVRLRVRAWPYEVPLSRMRYRGACSHGRPRLICRDIDPHQVAPLKPNDHQAVEQLEANSWHNEQVDGADVREVITKEGLPSLRWWPTSTYHVLGNSRLGDVEAQLEQLALDARGSPQRVRLALLCNECAQLGRKLWPADAVAGSPAPIGSEANTVPAIDRLRPDDRKGVNS